MRIFQVILNTLQVQTFGDWDDAHAFIVSLGTQHILDVTLRDADTGTLISRIAV